MAEPRYDMLDPALEPLRSKGPLLKNGFVNHAPMAAEALVAMGQGGLAKSWVRANLGTILPANDRVAPLDPTELEHALGDPRRQDAWRSFFHQRLADGAWEPVLDEWANRLAPGLFAAAAHGIIRVGHGVRALRLDDTSLRRRELAEGLALWASAYQPLVTHRVDDSPTFSPKEALAKVPLVPLAHRRNEGAITTALEQLPHAQGFAEAISLVDVSGDLPALANDIASEFAQVFLYRVHTPLTAIVFTHAITTVAAILNIAPHVKEETIRKLVSYGWQTAAGLHAAYSEFPAPGPGDVPMETAEEIAVRAATHGDDHVIKLSEACLRFYEVTHDDRFLMVPSHARTMLPEIPFRDA
ncbi:MAG: questin oxidase family protein [Rhodobiaceae bacterium]|nr:questin oxidase family protein [Rhodobiaceae bacterium]